MQTMGVHAGRQATLRAHAFMMLPTHGTPMYLSACSPFWCIPVFPTRGRMPCLWPWGPWGALHAMQCNTIPCHAMQHPCGPGPLHIHPSMHTCCSHSVPISPCLTYPGTQYTCACHPTVILVVRCSKPLFFGSSNPSPSQIFPCPTILSMAYPRSCVTPSSAATTGALRWLTLSSY